MQPLQVQESGAFHDSSNEETTVVRGSSRSGKAVAVVGTLLLACGTLVGLAVYKQKVGNGKQGSSLRSSTNNVVSDFSLDDAKDLWGKAGSAFDTASGAGVKQMMCAKLNTSEKKYVTETSADDFTYANLCDVLGDGTHPCVGIQDNNECCTGAMTCASPGTLTKDIKCSSDKFECMKQVVTATASCFPGDSMVQVSKRGTVPISDLRKGDDVLSLNSATGDVAFEPVIGHLHVRSGGLDKVSHVKHSDGELRASRNHIVFVDEGGRLVSKAVGDLVVGDRLALPGSSSAVESVQAGFTDKGMFAPLTASGTILVDGVVASVYGQPSDVLKLPHALVHAAFFPVRVLAEFGIASWSLGAGHDAQPHDAVHPFAMLLMPLQRLLSK